MDDEQDRQAVLAAARTIDLDLPAETLAGVVANRRMIEEHRRRVSDALDRYAQR